MSDHNLQKELNKDEPKDHKTLSNQLDTENSSVVQRGEKINTNPNIKKYNEILAMDIEGGKDGDKMSKKDIKKNFPIYGYYVRKPVWVFYESGGDSLDYDSSRNIFVLFVLVIVLIMLLATAFFVMTVLSDEDLSDFFEDNSLLLFLPAMIIIVALSYSVSCSPCVRMFPCSVIVLLLAVICMSVIVTCISVSYSTDLLMLAVFATVFVVACCCLLALTSIDFTKWYLFVAVISLSLCGVLLVMGITGAVTGESMPMTRLILLLILTVVNCIILTIEIQMVLGGKSVAIDDNDYALGAFMIYISIVNIFLDIVKVLGLFDEI